MTDLPFAKRYGAKPERAYTIDESPGQTAQEIMADDCWDEEDIVYQLAYDLVASQARIVELEARLDHELSRPISTFKVEGDGSDLLIESVRLRTKLASAEAEIARVQATICAFVENLASFTVRLNND